MNIKLVNGLLLTSLNLTYRGHNITIDDLVVDTGSSHTLLSADAVSEVGVYFENGDQIINAFGIGGEESCFQKKFDTVQFGSFQTDNIKLDIGNIHGNLKINGLIGLDLLMEAKIILDLPNLQIYSSPSSKHLS